MRNERVVARRCAGLAGVAALLLGLWSVSGGRLERVEARAQQGGSVRPPADTTTMEPPVAVGTDDPMKERMKEAAVGDRHKRLVADSDRLVELATELKVEVDKSTKNETSVIAIKKAAEIEKLAHDVKERMKGY